MVSRKRNLKIHTDYAEFIKHYPLTAESLDGEEWRDIEGFDGFYQVSTYGRVKSLKWGRAYILKPQLAIYHYLFVDLRRGDKRKAFKIHRLVAEAFIPNPENKPEVNHLYSRFNNSIWGLEWATRSENMKHARATGLLVNPKGVDNLLAKVKDDATILYIRENPNKLSQSKLAKEVGLSASAVSLIQLGKTYANSGGIVRDRIERRIPENVRQQIKAEYRKGVRGYGSPALAKKYGLSQVTILNIVNEK